MKGSRALDEAEQKACLSAAVGSRERAFIGCFCFLGGRISEILSLNLGDVCRGGLREAPEIVGEIVFRRATTKGRAAGRAVLVHPTLRTLLAQYIERERGLEPGPLFQARKGGHQQGEERRLSRTQGWRIVHRIFEAAGVKDRVSPHSFRKSFGTSAHARGASLKTVQRMLGHRDIRTTELYCDTTDGAERAAVLTLPSLLGDPPP